MCFEVVSEKYLSINYCSAAVFIGTEIICCTPSKCSLYVLCGAVMYTNMYVRVRVLTNEVTTDTLHGDVRML